MITIHRSGQLSLPFKEKKRGGLTSILRQATSACGQFFDRVDIDRTRNLYKNLSTPLIDWLSAGREEVFHIRRQAFKANGAKAIFLLTGYETANYARMIGRRAYLSCEAPLSIRAFTRGEKLLGLTLLLLGSCTALSGNSSAVEAARPVVATRTASVVPAVVTLPTLTTRPEVGVYADPAYRHPHLRIEMGPSSPIQVTFGTLVGEKANSGWYARYIGVPIGTVPREAVVDPLAQHARMFAVKFDPDASWEVQPVARTMDEQYAEMYNTQRTYMTLSQFVAGVRTTINETRVDIDWTGLCADRHINLNPEQCTLLQQVTNRITPEMIVTYGMTELFPREQSRTHDFNRRILEHGLINYGREFWDLTPAQSDGLASAGLWQLTSKAVGAYIDDDGTPRIGGVTIVGRYVENRPPESFLDFKRTDHEQAAFLFAVHNIALLIKEGAKNPHSLATMRRVWVEGDRRLELLQYIATAHHAPYGVYRSALRWLNAGAVRPYQSYLRGRFVEYAKRTRLNWPSMAPAPTSSTGGRS